MDTSTEYSQIYWPLHQQIKWIEKEPHNRKKLHRGHLQKCGYIILNIRSMFWIIALRKIMFPFIGKYLSYQNETKGGTRIEDCGAYRLVKVCKNCWDSMVLSIFVFIISCIGDRLLQGTLASLKSTMCLTHSVSRVSGLHVWATVPDFSMQWKTGWEGEECGG